MVKNVQHFGLKCLVKSEHKNELGHSQIQLRTLGVQYGQYPRNVTGHFGNGCDPLFQPVAESGSINKRHQLEMKEAAN
jgi:hypothetical protein